MTTLRITLDDETFERLKELAARANQPIEIAVEETLRDVMSQSSEAAEIDAIAARLVKRYASLFHRLAQ